MSFGHLVLAAKRRRLRKRRKIIAVASAASFLRLLILAAALKWTGKHPSNRAVRQHVGCGFEAGNAHRSSLLLPAPLDCKAHQLRRAFQPELFLDVQPVAFHRFHTQVQHFSDLLTPFPLADVL